MSTATERPLAERLRLIVITDARLARPRTVTEVIETALAAGAPTIQLRNRGDSARELLAVGKDLRSLTRSHGALLFVNDRLDVALAIEADGVHLGPEDLPIRAARSAVGPRFLIGRSEDDPLRARIAVEEGASYIGCGAVFPTTTKGNAGSVIGLDGLDRVAKAVTAPVVAIGGITADRARMVAGTRASGVAVIGAVMRASNVAETVRSLLSPWERPMAN